MHLRSNEPLSNEEDPYSLRRYPLKYQIIIGKQAHNARQLVEAAQAKGAYLNMYRQPLTSAQIERLKVLVPHELARRNAVARRIDFGSGTTSGGGFRVFFRGAPADAGAPRAPGQPDPRDRSSWRAQAAAHDSAIRQVAEERRELVNSARVARAAERHRRAQTPRLAQTPPRLARRARRRPSP